jgi:RNA polymerase sigma factor for flagellar operon FliA
MSAASEKDLIQQGQALVRSLATRISRQSPPGVDFEDLVAYGELGLAEAARDFDPDKGCQFVTFAYYRIRGAIYDGLAKMTWTSRSRYRRLRFEQMAGEALAAEAGEAPRDETLVQGATWLGKVTDRLAVVYFATHGDESGGGIRDSTLEDPGAMSAPAIVARREISQQLRAMLETLPKVERDLIEAVYFQGTSLQEAANQLSISKSWASRLHARTLEKLGQSLRRMGVSES